MHRGSRLITAPTVEPVTADELRTHLRETSTSLTSPDADAVIAEARQFIEDMYGIAMITQTWQMTIDRWPSQGGEPWWDGVIQGHVGVTLQGDFEHLELNRFPLTAVNTLTVYDTASNATVVNVAATFNVDTQSIPGRITLKSGQVLPIATRSNNAIEIVYDAGYAAAASGVPAPLKRAVKQLAAYLYTHRGDGCDMGAAMNASGVSGIMDAYSVARI